MRGLIDKERKVVNSLIKNVKFISPSNKLKVDKSITQNKLDKAKDKKEYYDITKGLGKIYCLALIKDSEKHFLTRHEKQDDLCDCFLQGFQYLFNPLPKIYMDKLNTIDESKFNIKNIKSKKNKAPVISENKEDNKDNVEENKENINTTKIKLGKKEKIK